MRLVSIATGLGLALAACPSFVAAIAAQGSMTWTPVRGFYSRSKAAMAYDTARDRVVLFGGVGGGSALGDTWEWNGSAWLSRRPITSPPPRSQAAMAYDSFRQRVVLFGGYDGVNALDDMWEWDGDEWLRLRPTITPIARWDHAMVYDEARRRLVVVAGISSLSGPARNDTWEWDGTTWSQRDLGLATRPPARSVHSMAYDPVRRRTVLFGGRVGSYTTLADTWEWDGTVWTLRAASGPPAWDSGLVFDSARQLMVLAVFTGPFAPMQVWEWNNAAWTQRAATGGPREREDFGMVYDNARQRVVIACGNVYVNDLSDTWEWRTTGWTRLDPGVDRVGSHSRAMAFDAARARMVLFGGYGPSAYDNDTWEWDGQRWSEVRPTVRPGQRLGHAMAYDAARQRTVLFGGRDQYGALGDTWEWDGTNWTQRTPAARPSPRYGHAMVFDIARQRVVLHGGFWPLSYSEMWEWDGTTWIMVPSGTPSPQRYDHGLAYDAARRRLVLYGGFGTSHFDLTETWEWDGSRWSLRVVASNPGPLTDNAMSYDPVRQRVLLVGTLGAGTHAWEWDGTSWLRLAAPRYGGPRQPLAWDGARQEMLYPSWSGTCIYRPSMPAEAVPVGNACAGTNGRPVLTSGEPFLGNATFALDASSARPAAPCAFALSSAARNVAVGGGCTLYVGDPLVWLAAVTNGGGFASVSVGLPFAPRLRGLTLYGQAFIVDPGGSALGMAFTKGRRIVLGN